MRDPGIEPPGDTVVRLVTALAERQERSEAAGALAGHLGAAQLLLFIRDPEVDAFLPAPGFRRTMPGGGRWAGLLRAAAEHGQHEESVPFDGLEPEPRALAIGRGECVLVLVGGAPERGLVDEVVRLLPLLAAAMQAEQAAALSAARADAARAAAEESSLLAMTLDGTRQQLRDLYGEVRNALRARDDFLAMAAHELKTPLTTIKGYAQLLARRLRAGGAPVESQAALVGEIESQVERMSRIVAELIEVFRGQQRPLHSERADLVAFAGSVLSRFEHDPMLTPQHRLVLDGPEQLDGSWDLERLDQVLTNLISNAIKYSPQGGEVRLEVEADGERVVLRVSDQGIGMDAEDMRSLFHPFYRSPRVGQIEGSGLGLHITSLLVQQQGGTIEVTSTTGEGTTFVVRLPLGISPDGR